MLARLNRLAMLATQRSDIVIACFMLLAVVMMILPLPTPLVDLLIGLNIALSMLILITAFYISRPADFSVLPPIILLSTLFRLALSITTTRLILRDGDAGEIVAAFGNFVIAGEIVVGLVIFLIITVAQFIVITKGSERVAEVTARFSLDAMPGKQMSIDNDLRNGDIDQVEARARRSMLERESQLFGAMDGAMKFVKGDAIASLIILVVNLLGGLLIGMAEHGMPFALAGKTYSLLSVGDGLVAQIPSLLTALAAGIVVTRVASGAGTDLGSEIVTQLSGNMRALWLTTGILLCMALVPGFPAATFLTLAVALGAATFALNRRRIKAASATQDGAADEPPSDARAAEVLPTDSAAMADGAPPWPTLRSGPDGPSRVTVRLGPLLAAHIIPTELVRRTDEMRAGMARDNGLEAPAIIWLPDAGLMPEQFRIDIDNVPCGEGVLPAAHARILDGDSGLLAAQGVAVRIGAPLLRDIGTRWISLDDRSAAVAAGLRTQPLEPALAACVRRALEQNSAAFLGLQETRELMARVEAHYPELVNEAQRLAPLPRMASILRRLLEERIPLTNMRAVLEAIVQWSAAEPKLADLSEHVRAALVRQLCHMHAAPDGTIAAYILARPLELALRQAAKNDAGAHGEVLGQAAQHVVAAVQDRYADLDESLTPVVVTAADLRRYVHQLLAQHQLDLPVLAYTDLQRGYVFTPLAMIDIAQAGNAAHAEPLAA
jgi:type III secretion protein V